MRKLQEDPIASNECSFDMAVFAHELGDEDETTPKEMLEGCGTAACLAGHIPLIDPEFTCQTLAHQPNIAWEELGRHFAGLNPEIGYMKENAIWKWLYSHHWAHIDNTPGGASERIKTYLKDEIPEKFMQDPMKYFFENGERA